LGIPAPIGVAASGLPPQRDQANAVISGQITAIGPQAPFAFRGPMNLAIWASINTALTVTAGSTAATVASGTGLAAGVAINSSLVPPGTTASVVAGTNVTLAPPPVTLWCKLRADGQVETPAAYPTAALLGSTVTIPSGVVNATLPSGTKVNVINRSSVAPTGGPGSGSPGVTGLVQLTAAPTAVPSNAGALPPVEGPIPLVFAVTGNAILTSGADAAATFTGGAVSWNGTLQLERSFDGGSTFVVCNVGTGGTLAQWIGATVTPISICFGEPEKNVLYRFNQTVYSSGTINYRVSQTGGAAESLAIGPLTSG
jgi:hypothetical protein